MTATQQFISDAINSGWGSHLGKKWRISVGYIEHMQTYWGKGVWERVVSVSTVLLDPLAWQAVGKTRGWTEEEICHYSELYYPEWQSKQHVFIDYLADGKTIEEALNSLET